MNVYAVILAGGVGSRFWPMSREKRPKHLLDLFGKRSLLQQTYDRIKPAIKPENIIVITNRIQKLMIKDQLPDIPSENIIDEPFGKNTSAAICLASLYIEQKDKEAITVVLPADHLIDKSENFVSTITKAAEFASNNDGIVTIGIEITRPETEYGYIQFDEKSSEEGVFKALSFAEKPPYETAKRFMKAGDFMWNSGIFVWRLDSLRKEMEKYLPDHVYNFSQLRDHMHHNGFQKELTKVYGKLKRISIDYGIMEKSDKVFLIKGNFEWNDVGDWQSVYELGEKDKNNNVIVGNIYTEKTNNSYINVPEKYCAVVGVQNCIVVDTGDALLICDKKTVQNVKNIVDSLKLNDIKELL